MTHRCSLYSIRGRVLWSQLRYALGFQKQHVVITGTEGRQLFDLVSFMVGAWHIIQHDITPSEDLCEIDRF